MAEFLASARIESYGRLLLAIYAGSATFLLIRWVVTGFPVTFAIDYPNARSLHQIPVPRAGGLAIIVATMPAAYLVAPYLQLAFTIGIGLAMLSLIDDLRGLRARWRLLAHFVASGAFVWMWHPAPWYEMVLVVLGLVWMINLYNFMDGSDGLAGGMTFVGFAAYGVAAGKVGDLQLSAASFSLAAASLAFLWFNFHPAKVFLGDVGSIPLGFFAGSFGVIGWRRDYWPMWFPILVFSPFIFDATLTLIRRVWRRENVWSAHRNHYYQRLVRMGCGHKKTALVEYALMLLASCSAVWGLFQTTDRQIVLLVIWFGGYVAMAAFVDRVWERRELTMKSMQVNPGDH